MWSTKSIDTISDYYLLTHPNPNAPAGNFKHRLCQSGVAVGWDGDGQRPFQPAPRVGILHVPVFERMSPTGDQGAEATAYWLSINPYRSTVHAAADTDSRLQLLPMDSCCRGCGNPNTKNESWEIEIAGWGPVPALDNHGNVLPGSHIQLADYWAGPEARKKLVQAAKCYVESCVKCFGKNDWRYSVIPLQRMELNLDGSVKTPGWGQHRDVPWFWGGKWNQYPDNIRLGQHVDICEDFPFDIWFQVLAAEINLAATS